jgi:hypothetical protein
MPDNQDPCKDPSKLTNTELVWAFANAVGQLNTRLDNYLEIEQRVRELKNELLRRLDAKTVDSI